MYASKNVRLFKNPLLERLSYVHPVTPGLIFGPCVSFLLFQGAQNLTVSALLTAVLAGIFLWTLMEYTLHRFVFHFPAQNRFSKRVVYIFHGIHHDDPEDARRLVMPPTASLAFAVFFYTLFRWMCVSILGASYGNDWFKPFFAGFLVGYLCYDYIHFWVHFATPKTKVGRYLKQYHMLHHFVTPQERFGVSNPLWDLIVGTNSPLPQRAKRI